MTEREHHENCCTRGEGSLAEELECDAECWCHKEVPDGQPSYDPRAAGTVYPTNQGDGLHHHGCCGCPDCRGGFAGRQTAIIHPPEGGWVPGVIYVQGQTYKEIGALVRDVSESIRAVTALYECEGCGGAVSDTDQHNLFHSKTRSIV